MTLSTIAILSPGDMGSAVGRSLAQAGHQVITCLQGRSPRTRSLSQDAGIRDVPSLQEMVQQADLILSIMAPSDAVDLARSVAAALRDTGATPYFAECNAVSPQTTREMEAIITEAGGRYIDAGIIGGPPGKGGAPRFYVSGPHHPVMLELDGQGIQVKPLGDAVGRASAIKMCYASMSKGTWALYIALLTAAESLGLFDELKAEFAFSQPQVLKTMESRLASVPAKAGRWVGEMEEIAATFASQGVTPHFHQGAADMYRLIGRSPFASELVGAADESRDLAQTIRALADLVTSEARPII